MRIVLFGCQKIANDVIDFILTTPHKLVAVITHDEARDTMFSEHLVEQHCAIRGIPTIRFDGKIDASLIASYKPDIMFSVYYRKILSRDVLNAARMGCVNIHPGILPKDRGPNPTYWNVRRGDKYAGTTLHYIDEGMDTGDIIAQDSMLIEGRNGFELNRDIMKLGVELFEDNFEAIIGKTNKRYVQDIYAATCNNKFVNNFRYIDWGDPADSIVNHIAAHAHPYGQSISRLLKSNEDVKFNKAEIVNAPRASEGPGSFVCVDGNLLIQTHTKPILVRAGDWSGSLLGKDKGRFISGVPQ